MSATAIIASINSTTAAKAQDTKTLTIKLVCGGLITLNFGNSSQMEAVAQVIIDAVRAEPEPEFLVPTTPVAVDGNGTDAGKKKEAEDCFQEDNASYQEEDASADSAEVDAPGSPESSFESYDGYGLTQEINF